MILAIAKSISNLLFKSLNIRHISMLDLHLLLQSWSLHWASSNVELAKALLEAKAEADIQDRVMCIRMIAEV